MRGCLDGVMDGGKSEGLVEPIGLAENRPKICRRVRQVERGLAAHDIVHGQRTWREPKGIIKPADGI